MSNLSLPPTMIAITGTIRHHHQKLQTLIHKQSLWYHPLIEAIESVHLQADNLHLSEPCDPALVLQLCKMAPTLSRLTLSRGSRTMNLSFAAWVWSGIAKEAIRYSWYFRIEKPSLILSYVWYRVEHGNVYISLTVRGNPFVREARIFTCTS